MNNGLPKLNAYNRITINPGDLEVIIKAAKANGLEIRSLVPKYEDEKIKEYYIRFRTIK